MVNPVDYKVTAAPLEGHITRPGLEQAAHRTPQDTHLPTPHFNLRLPFIARDESDPLRCVAELVQRGHLILDVSAVDLETSEATFGPLHPTTWHFRHSLNEAQQSWDRLRAEVGTKVIEAALRLPPLMALVLGESRNTGSEVVVILIGGQTYQAERVMGTELAPVQWRLTRLRLPLENGPYYICRLADGSTQCDCANWTYRIAETEKIGTSHCKHVEALRGLGWI